MDFAVNFYSIYNQDVERRGELVIDGSLYPTGPVMNKCWKIVLNDKAKTNLPMSKIVNPHSKVPNLAADVYVELRYSSQS